MSTAETASQGSEFDHVKMIVEGKDYTSSSAATIGVVNPSNGRQFLCIPEGSAEDVERAVESARSAFDDERWTDVSLSTRKRTLSRLADLLAVHGPELDRLDAAEMGKPVGESLFNAAAAADLMRFYAESVDKVLGDVYPADRTNFAVQRRVPRGVVAAIVPWNFPTYNAVLKVAPALAAGNCVILKPSELASRSAVHLAKLATEAGLPAGVLNVVLGRGETVGRALGLHSKVDMVAFTGSTEVGKCVLKYAAESNMKTVVAECGGKSPQIIFDDGVDLDAACDSIAGFLLVNQGQICSVGSRLLVEESIERVVLDKLLSRLGNVVIGDALSAATTFGPLASKAQLERVMAYIVGGARDGAQLVSGGTRALTATGGYFVAPTVFCGVRPDSRIAQEEIFGPVLSVMSFRDEEEAVRIANGTAYGLAAYVWSSNMSTGLRMAKRIRSSVYVNAAAPVGEGAGNACSSEPTGQSGIGTEGGIAGMEGYMRRHLIWFSHE
jgi:acyl-CoA reductase-like NAD-dependent aldehyde dehydrogenase